MAAACIEILQKKCFFLVEPLEYEAKLALRKGERGRRASFRGMLNFSNLT